MRLTQQGANRLTDEACQFNGKDFYLIPSLLETHDFDPNEFTGAVVFSINEVEEILMAHFYGEHSLNVYDLLAARLRKAKKVSE